MIDGARLAVAFARVLRGAGLDVPTTAVTSFAEALAAVGVERRDGVYWAARATLTRRPEDVDVFDAAFDLFWLGVAGELIAVPPPPPLTLALDEDDHEEQDDGEGDGPTPTGPTVTVRYSATEVLRHKDFAACTDAELDEARRLMTDVRLVGAARRSRRLRSTHGHRGRHDLRRTVQRSLRAGGEPVPPARRSPSTRPRRVVLLVDVSGSMEPYARALLRFAHAAVVGRGRVEVFALGTRLTRLTRELATHDPDAALAAASGAVADWSGGTRLGDGVAEFCNTWGVRGMARGAVVVVLSDGWDRGDPTVLGEQMSRLRRVAHRVVWVNPLKASPGYAPLAAGMAAALPHVDHFVEGHSLASLEELAEVVAGA
ncbi:MAG TPA: VWA domain-containing protein [Acidimicrobiales bacterium]|nr:VWA domain-containing protein [Acidimicrobiales bacterium]